jgi:hypothetical protein
MGERRGLNPRMVESQSTALPLGYAHQSRFSSPVQKREPKGFESLFALPKAKRRGEAEREIVFNNIYYLLY